MTRAHHRSGELPLIAWGDALRAARIRRRTLRRRVAFVAGGIALLGLTILLPPAPRLVWNASPSAPIGLYAVSPGAPVAAGDMVIASPPERFRMLAAARHYLPLRVPLVKRVAAVSGDEVCALGPQIFIEGRPVATRRTADGHGRPMPWWDGCVRLRNGQVFLLTARPESFDGRYIGVTERRDLIGKARPLWSR